MPNRGVASAYRNDHPPILPGRSAGFVSTSAALLRVRLGTVEFGRPPTEEWRPQVVIPEAPAWTGTTIPSPRTVWPIGFVPAAPGRAIPGTHTVRARSTATPILPSSTGLVPSTACSVRTGSSRLPRQGARGDVTSSLSGRWMIEPPVSASLVETRRFNSRTPF